MADNNIDYSRVGWNIKCLREVYGETLQDLMNAIGAGSTGTISDYESGKRIPGRDTLLYIAKHYGVTEHELIHGDFSNLSAFSLSEVEINDGAFVLEHILPIVTSSRAMENPSFRMAYKLHKCLFQILIKGHNFSNELSSYCVKLYMQADSEGVPEAVANRLWWLFIEGITIRGMASLVAHNTPEFQMEALNLGELMKKYILWKSDDAIDENIQYVEKELSAYIQKIDPEYVHLLKKLNQYPDYKNLVGYYSALRHYFGLIANKLTFEMNVVVGKQMLITLAKVGNEYASIFCVDGNE